MQSQSRFSRFGARAWGVWRILFLSTAITAFSLTRVSASDDNGINHVHISGQSLALGVGGAPALSTEGSVNHLMFDQGLFGWAWNDFVPLSQSGVETVASGMGETLTNLLEEEAASSFHRMLFSLSGVGGKRIDVLDKAGGDPYWAYARGIWSLWKARWLSFFKGWSYRPAALVWIQGESDLYEGTSEQVYSSRLLQLQRDFEGDASLSSGVSRSIPMFIHQTNAVTGWLPDNGAIPQAQRRAGVENDQIHTVSPIYFLDYSDQVHLTNHGYRHLGAYFAKAYKQIVVDKVDWHPLQPLRATRVANVITIDFEVPEPPLVFDEESVSNPGDYGFVVRDGIGRLGIREIRLAGDSQVVIITERFPEGEVEVRYAYDGPHLFSILWNSERSYLGARGNLRDSDPRVGFGLNEAGEPYQLYNWSVVFRMNVSEAVETCTAHASTCADITGNNRLRQ